jgi:hypothetical protein
LRIANLSASGGVGYFVHRAQRNVCNSLGWYWLDWDGTGKQLEDFSPDLVIMDVGRKDAYKPIGCKIAMIVSQWTDDPIWPQLYSRGYYTNTLDFGFVEQIDPTILYHHCTPNGIAQGFKFWKEKAGRDVISAPLYADFDYFYRPINEEFKYDVSYVGGKWLYKALVMNDYLLPVLQNKNIFSIVYGNRGWENDRVNFRGILHDDAEAELYSVSRVVPCCHEPHSHLGYDVVIRCFSPLLSGAAVVTDPNPSIYGESIFEEDEIWVASNPKEYLEKIEYLIRHLDSWISLVEKGQKRVAKDYTMEENLAILVEACGFLEEAKYAREFARRRYISIF